MSEDILVAGTEGNVRTLRLNRPGRANALSQELLTRLADELVAAESDPRIWAVVLTGTGTTFCAGADLKEMAALDSGQARQVRPKVSASTSLFELPLQMETPVIAALNGNAVAGGFELALACDIRIGAQGARFGFPEAKRGMGAAFGTVVLPRLIPQGIAMELLYTGRYIEADEAWRLGLLNRLVDPDEVLPTAMRLATEIAQNAPITVRRMKANVLAASGQPLLSALRLDSGPDPYSSEDRVEGVQAFLRSVNRNGGIDERHHTQPALQSAVRRDRGRERDPWKDRLPSCGEPGQSGIHRQGLSGQPARRRDFRVPGGKKHLRTARTGGRRICAHPG
jgi:enoyl-CoA hydratase